MIFFALIGMGIWAALSAVLHFLWRWLLRPLTWPIRALARRALPRGWPHRKARDQTPFFRPPPDTFS